MSNGHHQGMNKNVPPARRPAIVTVLAVLFGIETLAMLMLSLIYLAETGIFSQRVADMVLSELSDVAGPFVVIRAIGATALLIACFVTTIGLLRMRRWAWNSGMVILGIHLAEGLGEFVQGSPGFGFMFLTVLIVFLFNQYAVRKAFGVVKENRVPTKPVKRAG